MKAKLYDQIKTLVEIQDDFSSQLIPQNTLGTVVECYENPEGYAVDVAIPNPNLVGDFEYFNPLLSLSSNNNLGQNLKVKTSLSLRFYFLIKTKNCS